MDPSSGFKRARKLMVKYEDTSLEAGRKKRRKDVTISVNKNKGKLSEVNIPDVDDTSEQIYSPNAVLLDPRRSVCVIKKEIFNSFLQDYQYLFYPEMTSQLCHNYDRRKRLFLK